MGGRVAWSGPATLAVQGVRHLHGSIYRSMPDRLEAATFLLAGAITGGDVTVERVVPAHLRAVTAKLQEAGALVEEHEHSVRVRPNGPLRAVDVRTYRYPGFPTDIQQPFGALLTQAEGESSIQDTVFDDRLRYLDEIARMGADVNVKGQMALIRGPALLRGAEVRALDLRAGAAVVLAGLAADGETTIVDAENIDRGYTAFAERISELGGDCRAEWREKTS
jgi:UDP-N-acetylglucosamine 1-carboxyvinyltransferase